VIKFGDIKGFFRPDLVVTHLENLPQLETPVMDLIFADRVQLPFPLVSVEEMKAVLNELPVVRRGGMAIPATSNNSVEINTIEPLPVRMTEHLAARDLLDLYALNGMNRELWVKNKLDKMRRVYRKTVESLCAVSLTGKIVWPMHMGGANYEDYEVSYGTPENVAIEKKWDVEGADIKDVFKSLKAMKKALKANGYGSNLEVWAGDQAYETLFGLTDHHPAKSSVPVTVSESHIDVSGFKVKDRSETYRNPATGDMHAVVEEDEIVMIAKDAGHKLAYCAVDDFDANFQATPFFVKPVKTDEPSAISLIGEGKPLPIVNVKGICKAKVVTL